jgi:hypothetical protein
MTGIFFFILCVMRYSFKDLRVYRKDWEIEAAHMSQLYEDSDFNIAAASPAGDDYGFLVTGP